MTIVVSIGEPDSPALVGEMTVDEQELGFVTEMVTDAAKLDTFVPGSSVKAKALAEGAGDDHPEFPVVRVEEGWSNNNRLWDAEELVNIAEQVREMEPVAHLGHIKEEDLGTAFPDPQTTWLNATTRIEPSQQKDRKGEPVTVFYAAGYNLPGAKVRTYLKTRAVRGVSWLGFGREVKVPGKGVQVKDFKLKALDWSRKHAEGMPTASVVAVTSEQTGGTTVGDKALSQVTPEEFKKENPNGYSLLVSEAIQEKDDLIAEQEEKIKVGDKANDLLGDVRKALGVSDDADPLAAIAALTQKLGEEAKKVYAKLLDKELVKRIPGDDDEAKEHRALVRRLVFQSEMEDKLKDATDEDAGAKLVSEQVEKTFNEDEMVKKLISEQTAPVVRRREELSGGGGSKDFGGYVKEETVHMS
jgi:hypothetical protein